MKRAQLITNILISVLGTLAIGLLINPPGLDMYELAIHLILMCLGTFCTITLVNIYTFNKEQLSNEQISKEKVSKAETINMTVYQYRRIKHQGVREFKLSSEYVELKERAMKNSYELDKLKNCKDLDNFVNWYLLNKNSNYNNMIDIDKQLTNIVNSYEELRRATNLNSSLNDKELYDLNKFLSIQREWKNSHKPSDEWSDF